MLSTILIIVALLVVAALVYLATLPGTYELRRTRLINTDPQTLFDKVRDFKSWPDWSPWLIHEPGCELVYSDNFDQEGGYYDWEGQFVGSGRLTHVKFDAPGRMEQKINFFKPFKSEADVAFEFVEKNGGTEIAWIMKGSMPFLFRFMIPRIIDMISKDYDFGLAMLGGIMDPTSEHPVINFEGDTEFKSMHVISRSFSGHVDEMVGAMKQGYPELMQYAEDKSLEITHPPITVYREVDLKKMHFNVDMSLPVAEGSDAGSYESKYVGGGKYFKTTLKGSYEYLEIAWYEAMGHLQMCKIKQDKSRVSFEVYENDPRQVSHSNELMTSIYVPVK